MKLFVTLLMALISAAPALAQTSASQPSPATRASDTTPTTLMNTEAERFAKVFLPKDLLGQTFRESLAVTMKAGLESSPILIEKEKQFPGFQNAVLEAAQAQAGDIFEQWLPNFQVALAALVAANLTDDELKVVNRYYDSPEGQRVVRLIALNVDYTSLAKEVLENRGNPIITGDIADKVKWEALADLTQAEREALIKFSESAAGQKFIQFSPLIKMTLNLSMISTFGNNAPKIKEAIGAAIDAHVAKLNQAKAAAK